MILKTFVRFLVLSLGLAISYPAVAVAIALDTYRLNLLPDDGPLVESAQTLKHLQTNLQLATNYDYRYFIHTLNDYNHFELSIINNYLVEYLGFNLGLWHKVVLGIGAPVILYMDGGNEVLNARPTGMLIGDPWIALRLHLLGDKNFSNDEFNIETADGVINIAETHKLVSKLALAVSGTLRTPLSANDKHQHLVREKNVHGDLKLLLSAKVGILRLDVNSGVYLRDVTRLVLDDIYGKPIPLVQLGKAFTFGVNTSTNLAQICDLFLQVAGSLSMTSDAVTQVQTLLGTRIYLSPQLVLTTALGPGLGSYNIPALRALLAVAYVF